MPQGPPIRVLVIGAGAAAAAMHLPVMAALRDRGELSLVHICDVVRERAAAARRKFGFAQESGDAVGALQRPEFDAVYLFAGAQLHYDYGLQAIHAGKHLFVEKPIAPSYALASALSEAARARSLIAAGGHNRRFYRSLAAVRSRGGKGGWRFGEAVFHKAEYAKPPLFGARSWLGANGIHALDALVFMMGGLPDHVSSIAGEPGAGQPSAFSALLRWDDGRQGVFLCNNNAGARREEYVFHGPDETCTVTDQGLSIQSGGRAETRALPSIGDGIAQEHESFLHAIRTGVEPPHSLACLAPSLGLAELIEEGFCGSVRLPERAAAPVPLAGIAGRKTVGRNAVLTVQAASLLPAISRWLPDQPLLSSEDVRGSADARPEVVAAILGRGSSGLTPELLAKCPNLGIVGVMGLSLAHYAPQLLLERGICVVNSSAAYAESAAELALGLAILARRRAFVSHRIMREGGWGTLPRHAGARGVLKDGARVLRPALERVGLAPFFLRLWRAAQPPGGGPAAAGEARQLRGATVGLVGWGAIARAFTLHLVRAGARVWVYSEHASSADIAETAATAVSLGQALAADIVSLHRGLTDRTRHFLGASELDKLRPGAVLINVARGALIEPAALIARLERGDIFACLDTYDEEPLPPAHALRTLPNVFLTSHIAGGSRDMHAAAADEVVRKVADHLAGRAVTAIGAERLSTMT